MPTSDRLPQIVALAIVAVLHLALLAVLSATGHLPPALRQVLPATLIVERRPALPSPPVPRPMLAAPPLTLLPVPDIQIADRRPPSFPGPARMRAASPASHFGAASETGLALDVGAASGGGAGARGTLTGFEAAVRARVLSGKRQPVLAWDRRNTCVVSYTVKVAANGTLAGLSIEPCAIPEINEAARSAIRQAAPFPRPPDLGAASYDVHGSLIFRP